MITITNFVLSEEMVNILTKELQDHPGLVTLKYGLIPLDDDFVISWIGDDIDEFVDKYNEKNGIRPESIDYYR